MSKLDPRHGLPLRERVRFSKLVAEAQQAVAPTAADADLVLYVRQATGNDALDGETEDHAVATLARARELAGLAPGRPVVIEVSGETFEATDLLNLGGVELGGIRYDLNIAALAVPTNYVGRQHRRIVASPIEVMDLTITDQTVHADSGLVTLTVSQTLVTNAHRGRIVMNASGEWGTIKSNATGTVTVDKIGVYTDTAVTICTRGATFRFGYGTVYDQAIYLNALCHWGFHGIAFESVNNNSKSCALTVWPNAPVDFTFCSFAGIQIHGGAGVVAFDACYFHDKLFVQDGATVRVLQSTFYGLDFRCHGSGDSGLNEWIGFSISASEPLGFGNAESRWQVQASNFHIDAAESHGIMCLFGKNSLTDGLIENCGDSAIFVDPLVDLRVTNVSGEGTTERYGIEAPWGPSYVKVTVASTTVTGALNDILLGATASAYAAGVTDTTRGVVYHEA
jgi:hypothetical protein